MGLLLSRHRGMAKKNIPPTNMSGINEFFSDPRFLNIQKQLSEPNIFNILSNATYEIRHSNFFAWLLDANETHDSATLFSSKIVPILAPDIKNPDQKWTVYREKDRVDILLDSERETICIENKTFSKDSKGQLSGYRNTVEKKYSKSKNIHYTYLTLNGEHPLDILEKEFWHTCSYSDVLKALKSILKEEKNIIPGKTRLYIEDYIKVVETLSTKTHQINSDAISIASDKKYNLMEIFNYNLDRNDLAQSKQYKALTFIKDNSPFTRGKGFFRKTNFFYQAFKDALEKHNFKVDEKQSNSTYLTFQSKSMARSLQEPALSKTISMNFRFFDKTSKLHFVVGLMPETNENKKLRNKIRDRIPQLQHEFRSFAVSSRGVHHIGLFNKKVEFCPLECNKDNVGIMVDRLIATEIKTEQHHIQMSIKKILAE